MMIRIISVPVLMVTPSYGWDKDGHDAVGGTAMSMLDSTASSKLKGILGGEDASDVAGWAHRIEKSLAWTAPIHFMAQESDWSCTPASTSSTSACPDGRCLESAIRHFFRQVTRGEERPGVNVMKDVTDFTDADALRFLINLVGDLSQALHAGFKSNNFGKDVFVRLPQGIPLGGGEVLSLFDLWDSKLSQNLINNPYNPNFWWSGWTHVRNLHPSVVESEKKLWNEKGIEAVHEWVKESAEYACKKIYSDPVKGDRLVLSTDKANPTEISQVTYRLWEQALRERILISGMRLGLLLNAVLLSPDGPSAAKLRRGSAVSSSGDDKDQGELLSNVFDDLDQRESEQSKRGRSSSKIVHGYSAGLFNVSILVIVALVLFVAMKLANAASPVSLSVTKSNLVEMVGPQARKILNVHKD